MRVAVIGATGHIGTYLVPRLVRSGHEVVALSRGQRAPYQDDPAWESVERVQVDRHAEDEAGTFPALVIGCRPDAVVDLVCFERSAAARLVEALEGSPTYLLHCGTIWVHGPGVEVPTSEELPRRPLEHYGIEKAAIEELLLSATAAGRLKATVLHPGHIVGPGWRPVNPAGNFALEPFGLLARGRRLTLPNFGLETVHHVHADDVALAFQLALDQPEAAIGEAFHVVSDRALTLRGYAEAVASWFAKPADLAYLPFEEWRRDQTEEDAAATLAHIAHSPSISIAKARSRLGYAPRSSSLEAVREALDWLISAGELDVGELVPRS